MSSAYRDWAWDQIAIADLEKADALILLCIADMANKEGKAWPSLAYIAKRTNIDPSSVWRSITHKLIPKLLLERARKGRSWLFQLPRISCATQDDIHCTTQDNPVDNSSTHRAPRKVKTNGHLAPRKRHIAPRNDESCITPNKPLSEPKKEPLSAPGGARGADAPKQAEKILEEKKEGAAAPSVPKADPYAFRLKPPPDTFGSWVDRGAPPDDTLHCATEADEVTEDTVPQTEADRQRMAKRLEGLVHQMARGMFSNYPPRAPQLTAEEQAEVVRGPPPLRGQLSPEQLAAMRAAAGYGRVTT